MPLTLFEYTYHRLGSAEKAKQNQNVIIRRITRLLELAHLVPFALFMEEVEEQR